MISDHTFSLDMYIYLKLSVQLASFKQRILLLCFLAGLSRLSNVVPLQFFIAALQFAKLYGENTAVHNTVFLFSGLKKKLNILVTAAIIIFSFS